MKAFFLKTGVCEDSTMCTGYLSLPVVDLSLSLSPSTLLNDESLTGTQSYDVLVACTSRIERKGRIKVVRLLITVLVSDF